MKDISRRFASAIFPCLLLLCLLAALLQETAGQQPAANTREIIPGPMLNQGLINLETAEFQLDLVRSSQTVAALKPKSSDTEGFDFTPGDLLKERSQDGYYHLGDLDLRLRPAKSEKCLLDVLTGWVPGGSGRW